MIMSETQYRRFVTPCIVDIVAIADLNQAPDTQQILDELASRQPHESAGPTQGLHCALIRKSFALPVGEKAGPSL